MLITDHKPRSAHKRKKEKRERKGKKKADTGKEILKTKYKAFSLIALKLLR